jgi:serine/threonine-protein kinase
MELEDEGSIGDLVRRSGPRPIDEVAPQLAFLLEGLAAAHQHGIIHRDLKPENVLLSRYRHWRIADFGIAAALGEDGAGTSGTPAFAPPEQLLGEPQGVAADLFAVAAIAYFALVGVAPFVGADARSILAQQLASKADLSKVPAELRDWFTKGLSVDPDARFADALVMRERRFAPIVARVRRSVARRAHQARGGAVIPVAATVGRASRPSHP